MAVKIQDDSKSGMVCNKNVSENNQNKFKLILLIVMIIITFSNCNKQKEMVLNGTSRITSGCDCTPPSQSVVNNPCGYNTVKCVKHFFNNGSFSRTYTIKWTSGCAAFTTSQVQMCYNSNCKFQIRFSSLPPCLSCCLQENKCYETDNFGCGGHQINIYFENTDCRGILMSFTITGDPDILVSCMDQNGNVFNTQGRLI